MKVPPKSGLIRNAPRPVATAAVISLLLSGTALASANAEEPAPTVTVHFDDLNLASQAGNETLKRRIHLAAKAVCSDLDDEPLELKFVYDRCVRDASERALESVQKRT
jgi:UrcA family protein